MRLLIVGNPGREHVGAHLLAAAASLGQNATLFDQRLSWSSNRWVNRLSYRFRERRPVRLRAFGKELQTRVSSFGPDLVIVTGIAAPDAATLRELRERGARTVNYLTDDPWNPKHRTAFFWDALREYDIIYSQRRANIEDLRRHGCRRVEYLPFGYNPDLHFPEPPVTDRDHERFDADVTIVGGADEDRVPLASALVRERLRLRLFGGYWNRWKELRPFYGGLANDREFRLAVGGATVNVCMVRRANRDGHAMRSLELPAMSACMVVEDTLEHRDLFGPEGASVQYYETPEQMAAKTRSLCAAPERARELGRSVLDLIRTKSRHTYADRLRHMLDDMDDRV